ncbi:MAG: pirin family protein [Methylococcales bacterium]
MLIHRPANERGKADFGWLASAHTFSFGQYQDDAWMGFGPLRVINEDRVAPGGGFATHGHADMEIISVVLDGALQHKDSIGTGSVIRPNEVQRMSAGSGIRHSEFNGSQTDPVHFLQIWIIPDKKNIEPSYEQKVFPSEDRQDRLRLVASPDGADGSLKIAQQASMYSTLLSPGAALLHTLKPGRLGWVQVVSGQVTVNGQALMAGDGLGLADEPEIRFQAGQAAELLLFDLPR